MRDHAAARNAAIWSGIVLVSALLYLCSVPFVCSVHLKLNLGVVPRPRDPIWVRALARLPGSWLVNYCEPYQWLWKDTFLEKPLGAYHGWGLEAGV